jgi:hypothetical protein
LYRDGGTCWVQLVQLVSEVGFTDLHTPQVTTIIEFTIAIEYYKTILRNGITADDGIAADHARIN